MRKARSLKERRLVLNEQLFEANTIQLKKLLARVVRKVDNAIHRINHCPTDSVVCFVNTYPLDSDLIYPVDSVISFEQLGPDLY